MPGKTLVGEMKLYPSQLDFGDGTDSDGPPEELRLDPLRGDWVDANEGYFIYLDWFEFECDSESSGEDEDEDEEFVPEDMGEVAHCPNRPESCFSLNGLKVSEKDLRAYDVDAWEVNDGAYDYYHNTHLSQIPVEKSMQCRTARSEEVLMQKYHDLHYENYDADRRSGPRGSYESSATKKRKPCRVTIRRAPDLLVELRV